MFDSLFNLPLVVVGAVIIVSVCVFALSGLAIFSRHILPRLNLGPRICLHQCHDAGQMVFTHYVALIAVSVWQLILMLPGSYPGATSVGVLYRDVSSYPEPPRSRLQQNLRDYLDYVIHQAWPLQRRGQVPSGGVEKLNLFQVGLAAFEPATEGQKLLHGETLRAYSQMIEARRLRLDAVVSGLPGVLWWVIIVGAIVSLSSTFFFQVEDARLQRIQVILLAIFIGLLIFMIFALDRPFRGELGVRPDPYQLIFDQLMKP
jgi:hypothetical protein